MHFPLSPLPKQYVHNWPQNTRDTGYLPKLQHSCTCTGKAQGKLQSHLRNGCIPTLNAQCKVLTRTKDLAPQTVDFSKSPHLSALLGGQISFKT